GAAAHGSRRVAASEGEEEQRGAEFESGGHATRIAEAARQSLAARAGSGREPGTITETTSSRRVRNAKEGVPYSAGSSLSVSTMSLETSGRWRGRGWYWPESQGSSWSE